MFPLLQILAALLITRQVIGNIKEALIPYIKQQLRFAKISFDLYGSISPTKTTPNKNVNSNKSEEEDADETVGNEEPEVNQRKLSQVEMESSRPAVSQIYCINQWFSTYFVWRNHSKVNVEFICTHSYN
jgi:hypothetical protein